jgi:hypothetical protein
VLHQGGMGRDPAGHASKTNRLSGVSACQAIRQIYHIIDALSGLRVTRNVSCPGVHPKKKIVEGTITLKKACPTCLSGFCFSPGQGSWGREGSRPIAASSATACRPVLCACRNGLCYRDRAPRDIRMQAFDHAAVELDHALGLIFREFERRNDLAGLSNVSLAGRER